MQGAEIVPLRLAPEVNMAPADQVAPALARRNLAENRAFAPAIRMPNHDDYRVPEETGTPHACFPLSLSLVLCELSISCNTRDKCGAHQKTLSHSRQLSCSKMPV